MDDPLDIMFYSIAQCILFDQKNRSFDSVYYLNKNQFSILLALNTVRCDF